MPKGRRAMLLVCMRTIIGALVLAMACLATGEVTIPAGSKIYVDSSFRRQYGPDYRADLDLIFANPDGTPFKPDSISSAVSLLFR